MSTATIITKQGFNGSDIGIMLNALGSFVQSNHAIRRNVTLQDILVSIENSKDQWLQLEVAVSSQLNQRYPQTLEAYPIGAIFSSLLQGTTSVYVDRALVVSDTFIDTAGNARNQSLAMEAPSMLLRAAYDNIYINRVSPYKAFAIVQSGTVADAVRKFEQLGWQLESVTDTANPVYTLLNYQDETACTIVINYDVSAGVRIEVTQEVVVKSAIPLSQVLAGGTTFDAKVVSQLIAEERVLEFKSQPETAGVLVENLEAQQSIEDDLDTLVDPMPVTMEESELLGELAAAFSGYLKPAIDEVIVAVPLVTIKFESNFTWDAIRNTYDSMIDKLELNTKKSQSRGLEVYDGLYKDLKFRLAYDRAGHSATIKLRGTTKAQARGFN